VEAFPSSLGIGLVPANSLYPRAIDLRFKKVLASNDGTFVDEIGGKVLPEIFEPDR
jgi:hypothetical protein